MKTFTHLRVAGFQLNKNIMLQTVHATVIWRLYDGLQPPRNSAEHELLMAEETLNKR